ncbi:hypothetical protein ABZ733_33665 [Streptomyces longwoodensis]
MQPLIDPARSSGHRPEEFGRPAERRCTTAPFTACPGPLALPAPLAGAR